MALDNIRFNHEFEVFNICCTNVYAPCKAEGINIDQGLQLMLNTENLLMHVIITQSNFKSNLYSYFQQLFQYFLYYSRSYIATT